MFPGIGALPAKGGKHHLSKDYPSYEKKTALVLGLALFLVVPSLPWKLTCKVGYTYKRVLHIETHTRNFAIALGIQKVK